MAKEKRPPRAHLDTCIALAAVGLDDDQDKITAAKKLIFTKAPIRACMSAVALGEFCIKVSGHPSPVAADAIETLSRWIRDGRVEVYAVATGNAWAAKVAMELQGDWDVEPTDALIIGAAATDPRAEVLFSWDGFVQNATVLKLARRYEFNVRQLTVRDELLEPE